MRVSGLNLSYTDGQVDNFRFEQVNDYFGPTTQQGVLFSRTKIEMSEDTSLRLKARDGDEVIEIRLRNYES